MVEYSEKKKMRFDNTLRLSANVLRISGIEPGETVRVTTESGSKRVILEVVDT